jgi:hypothetical protein
MDEITVEFFGVCTHIQWPEGAFTTRHRVVMVNSDAQGTVARHHTRVEICEGDRVLHQYDLDGHTVSVDGALDGALTYDHHYDCAIPRLLLDGFAESMTLSPRVTESPDKVLVSGLIDLPNASFTAKMRADGAAVGIATVQVEGPRRISIRRFGASEIIHVIDVPPGADVVFSNSANPGEDDATDFALNFLIAEPVPVITRMNEPRPCKQILPHTRHGWQSIGPGCSNTNFP